MRGVDITKKPYIVFLDEVEMEVLRSATEAIRDYAKEHIDDKAVNEHVMALHILVKQLDFYVGPRKERGEEILQDMAAILQDRIEKLEALSRALTKPWAWLEKLLEETNGGNKRGDRLTLSPDQVQELRQMVNEAKTILD